MLTLFFLQRVNVGEREEKEKEEEEKVGPGGDAGRGGGVKRKEETLPISCSVL